jgi:hypothetical protein
VSRYLALERAWIRSIDGITTDTYNRDDGLGQVRLLLGTDGSGADDPSDKIVFSKRSLLEFLK